MKHGMSKLLKYEFRKTQASKLILLGLTAVAQLVFLGGLFFRRENAMVTGALVLSFLGVGGILFIGLQSVLTLHRDMNTKQSYMLFMTPNSCYRILGAKVLENGLSILLVGVFFFALGLLDITLLLSSYGELSQLWTFLTDLLHQLNEDIQLNAQNFAAMMFGLIGSWFATVMMAYLADVVSSALLGGRKYNGLLSFALFLALSILLGFLQNLLPGMSPERIILYFMLRAITSIAFSVLIYFISAKIMERYLSV
ncbi:MAG: hypothetical protein IJ083_00385 [Clostridia bacterium]|nr:hypothetical protein [Clostridia bacterium]